MLGFSITQQFNKMYFLKTNCLNGVLCPSLEYFFDVEILPTIGEVEEIYTFLQA